MQYEINMDKNKIDINRIKELLDSSYWASNRDYNVIEKSIKHSECICVYDNDLIIGFARIVTDYSTVFWLADVIVDSKYRGRGIGKYMLDYISNLEYFKPLKGILATRDAFALYEKYGFHKEAEKYMSKNRGD